MKKFFLLFKKEDGYTLTEMIIALTLFISFFSIATASFVKAVRSQRDLNGLVTLSSNVGLILEQMAREIRTSYNFTTPTPSEIHFTNYYKKSVVYRLNNMAIERSEDKGSTYFPLTANDIQIDKLTFRISQGNNNNNPWRITIVVQAQSKTAKDFPSPFFLQTTISARLLPKETP